ncbi:MAG: SpoIIIAH-like family protein [Clostridia bacterium]|nr:SpoIIIAH-like family protein [Clostridia bacterium]
MKSKRFGKKFVVLGGLVVALGLAVYLNYMFTPPASLPVSGEGKDQTTGTTEKNLGESLYVNAETEGDYFASARLSRESARDEAIELIEELLEDVRLNEEVQQQALEKTGALADAVTDEAAIEQLVRAKGFEDCVAYIGENGCQLVVKADDLTDQQTLQILQIVTSQTTVPAQNINIVVIN